MGAPSTDMRSSALIPGVAIVATLAATAAAAYGYVHVIATGSYALLHLIVELVGIIVSAGVFMVVWNTRKTIANGYIVVIALAGIFVAGVDLMHALTYKGVDLIPQSSADLPTQLWLVARYLQAASIALAPRYVTRKASPNAVLAGFGAATAVLLGLIAVGLFPAAFVEGQGLTQFKVTSEIVISSVMVFGLVGLVLKRRDQDPEVFALMTVAIACLIAAELSFTAYSDPTAIMNYAGHILRIAGMLLIYRALVVAAIARPFDVLFLESRRASEALAHSEQRFRTTFDQAILGIIEIGLDGRIIRANARMGELIGRPAEELAGTDAGALTCDRDIADERALFAELEAGRIHEYRIEKRINGIQGCDLWVAANRSSVHANDGTVAYFIEMMEDITVRRETEAQLERSRDLKAALATIDVSVNSTLDLDEIISTAVTEGSRTIGADSAAVIMLEDRSWRVRNALGFREDISGTLLTDEQMNDMLRSDAMDLPLAISDALHDSRISPEIAARFGVRSLILIPLSFRGTTLGLLLLNFATGPREFDEDEIGFALELSSALTMAIENSRLYEAERRTVDTLQASLLSTQTDIPGVDFSTAYYSAMELARIGGDFFDVFSLPDDRVAFAVGDVSGKGIEAAAITAIAKSTVRAFAFEWGSPGRVVRAANQALLRQLDESRFVTLVYGLIDLATGDTRIVCAGHPSPLICDEHDCIEDVSIHNPPLAVFELADFQEFHTRLRPGMRVVAFSDGLLDARHGDEFLGEERVRDLIAGMGNANPSELTSSLLAAATTHSDGRPPDDIAILALRYSGPPGAVHTAEERAQE